MRFRSGLHPLFLPIYDALCEMLPDHWQPYRGMVTFEDQEGRFAQGRTVKGRILTHDRPGETPFNYGCASAWVIFHKGQPIQEIHPHDWAFFAQVVERAGGHWGGRIYRRDKGSVELPIKSTWVDVNHVRQRDGMLEAEKYIRKMFDAK